MDERSEATDRLRFDNKEPAPRYIYNITLGEGMVLHLPKL